MQDSNVLPVNPKLFRTSRVGTASGSEPRTRRGHFGVRVCQHRFGFVAQPFVSVSSRPFRVHFSTSPIQSFAKESKAVRGTLWVHRTPKALPVNARLVRTSRVGTASGSGLRMRRGPRRF